LAQSADQKRPLLTIFAGGKRSFRRRSHQAFTRHAWLDPRIHAEAPQPNGRMPTQACRGYGLPGRAGNDDLSGFVEMHLVERI